MFFGTIEDSREKILNKYKDDSRSSRMTDEINRWSFRKANGIEWNPDSGEDPEQLLESCRRIEREMQGQSRVRIKTEMFVYLMEHAQVAVEPWNIFASDINHGGILGRFFTEWLQELEEGAMKPLMDKNRDCESEDILLYTSNVDFNHVCPDWERMLKLGFPGIKAELEKSYTLWKQKAITDQQAEYFESGIRAWDAVLTVLRRLADECDRRASESDKLPVIAKMLRELTVRPPENTLEAMELNFFFYRLETQIENVNIRSVGGLDRIFWPFWKRDLERGTFTEAELTELWQYYLCSYSAFGVSANLPFYLAGQYADGSSAVSELTYRIIRIYRSLRLYDPKIHIRINRNTPRDLIELVCDTIRDGESSFAFISDDAAIKAMLAMGVPENEARNYAIVGCYEPLVLGREIPCTANGVISMPKVLELVMHNGTDPETGKHLMDIRIDGCEEFEDFYRVFLQGIRFCADRIVEKVSAYEKHYMELCPAPIYSATMPDSVKRGVDVYRGGAKYNNSSFNCIGLATTVDSLFALKKIVFEDRKLTLQQFAAILDTNWAGEEKLRTECRNECKKYGNGDREVDAFTARFAHDICSMINGRPNGRGGHFRAGLLGINWGFRFGYKAGATPDGRGAFEPMSKNYGAVNGMDRKGVTGLIRSVTSIDNADVPNGSVLDVMFHPSVVRGEAGLKAFTDIVLTYIALGGFAMHCNIFDAKVLKDAVAHPDLYRTLQVRVCGWNSYFVDLSAQEQNYFIEQAEALSV